MADVIALLYVVDGITTQVDDITSCCARQKMLLPLYYMWQMVSQLNLHVAIDNLADVIAKVADGITNQDGYN